ncbi:MAG: helix-turn-helix transcriptional regulator [Alicyclobacillus sp.]|nr:helix-turn-helix transcriptional regulator [Alicyclobacillus sp.]
MRDMAARLRQMRKERGLSVRQLAERADVSVSYVYAIENGERGSNLTKLNQIARALGVPLSQLWDEDSET